MIGGAAAALIDGPLAPAEVMDLVPVRPLAEDEAAIHGALQLRLRAMHAKLRS